MHRSHTFSLTAPVTVNVGPGWVGPITVIVDESAPAISVTMQGDNAAAVDGAAITVAGAELTVKPAPRAHTSFVGPGVSVINGDVYIEGSTMTFSTGGVIIGGSQLPDTSVALTITVPVAHDVIIDAVAGDVHLHGQVSQDVIISTATGAVTLHESAARVSNIETQSGDITIASVPTTARVVATSQSGDVKVGGVRGRLLAETMSGDITATAIDPSTYTIQLSSMAGDIYLGPAPSARMNLVQATTMSGRVLPL